MKVNEKIAASFGVDAARAFIVKPLGEAQLTVLHIEKCYEHGDSQVVLAADNAFMVMLYLRDAQHCDIASDGSLGPTKTYANGSICLVSLAKGAAISVEGTLDVLIFHIPVSHLAELAEEAGEPRIDDLSICRGLHDQVIHNMGAALMPLFDMPDQARDTLVPHIGLAFLAHIAHRYGRSPAQSLSASGRLTPLQEKRIKTYINTNLSRDIGIEDIAIASGFSVPDLSSGFEKTTGQSVDGWLLETRIARAMSYLAKTGESTSQIAEVCGFKDPISFAETFTSATGFAPGEWRLRNRH